MGLVLAVVLFLLWQERRAFPVKSVNCFEITGECSTVALFTTMQSCQWSNEYGNMGCQFNADKSQAICKYVPDALAHQERNAGRRNRTACEQ